MKCIKCFEETMVKDSRNASLGEDDVTKRRRMCLSCGFRHTTYELAENSDILAKAKRFNKVNNLINQISQLKI